MGRDCQKLELSLTKTAVETSHTCLDEGGAHNNNWKHNGEAKNVK